MSGISLVDGLVLFSAISHVGFLVIGKSTAPYTTLGCITFTLTECILGSSFLPSGRGHPLEEARPQGLPPPQVRYLRGHNRVDVPACTPFDGPAPDPSYGQGHCR
jgi:hypothetical protein